MPKNSLADRIRSVTEQSPENILDSIDGNIADELKTIHRTKLPDQSLLAQHQQQAVAYGEPQRGAINSVVDNIVRDICEEIGELRLALDTIEQRILENAASVKERLSEHVGICVSIKDEVTHIRRIIADIKERTE